MAEAVPELREGAIPEEPRRILVKSFYVGNSTEFLPFGVAALEVMERITHNEFRECIIEVRNQCSTLEDLMTDGYVRQVLTLLSTHINQPGVSWEQIIMYYVYIFRRPAASVEQKSIAYQHFLNLIKDSERLFFFLKLTSNFIFEENPPVKKKPHFGGGLKRAIIRWYMSKSLSELLLDEWLLPRVYTWTHKDVLKLLHWNIDRLGDEYVHLKMFVQYCFVKNYKNGKEEFINTFSDYAGMEDLFDVIKRRMMLTPQQRENYSVLQAVRLLSEDDRYPLKKHCDQILNDEKLLDLIPNLQNESLYFLCQETLFIKKVIPDEQDSDEDKTEKANICFTLIEELNDIKNRTNVSAIDILIFMNAYIKSVKVYCDGAEEKRKWLGGVAFPPVKTPGPNRGLHNPPNVSLTPRKGLLDFSPEYIVGVRNQLKENLFHQAKKASIAANHPGLLLVCSVTPRMRNYISTHPGLKFRKQMRGIQAILLMMYTFCYKGSDESNDGLHNRALVLTDGKNITPYPAQSHSDIYEHCMALFNLMKKPFGLPLETTLSSLFINWTTSRGHANTVVLVLERITPEVLESLQTELAKETNNSIKKFLLLGMQRNEVCVTIRLPYSSRLLVLNGFHSRTISIIQAFVEEKF